MERVLLPPRRDLDGEALVAASGPPRPMGGTSAARPDAHLPAPARASDPDHLHARRRHDRATGILHLPDETFIEYQLHAQAAGLAGSLRSPIMATWDRGTSRWSGRSRRAATSRPTLSCPATRRPSWELQSTGCSASSSHDPEGRRCRPYRRASGSYFANDTVRPALVS